MKKTVKLLCGLLCLVTALVFIFTGCNVTFVPVTPTNPTKAAPTYKGMFMSVSANVEIPADSDASVEEETEAENAEEGNKDKDKDKNKEKDKDKDKDKDDKENNGNADNNGNHYGWYKDDDGDGKVDETSEQQLCAVSQNQDVYFYIGFSNPDKAEIRSIKVGGKTYTSDMFEANSTDDVKIVKYNVGTAGGLVEYVLEEVKYFDGNEEKNVVIEGNNTAKASIKVENAVKAIVNNIELRDGGKEVFFDITIIDEFGLIASCNGDIKIIVSREGKDKKEAELTVGENKVTIQILNKNKEHEYEIVAYYDDLSGEGATYHTLVERQVIKQCSEHTYGEWIVEKAANCEEPGEEARTCSVCGVSVTRDIPVNGEHIFGEWRVTVEASCKDGEQKRECSVCGATETESIPANNVHAFGEWDILIQASCFVDGEKARVCSVCKEIETQIIPAPGTHSFGEWVIIKEATCVSPEEQARTCSVCKETETRSIPGLVDHSFGAWITINEATYTEDGLKIRICANCVMIENQIIPMLVPEFTTPYPEETTPEPPIEPDDPILPEIPEGTVITIWEANAIGVSQGPYTYTQDKYYVTGVVTEIRNTRYGNLYIADEEGNTLYIYGLYNYDGSVRFDSMNPQPVVGETITVYGVLGQYNGIAQIKNGWLVDGILEEDPEITTPEPPIEPDVPDVPDQGVIFSTIEEIASANGWVSGTPYESFYLSDSIIVSATGTPTGSYGLNTGKYYASGNSWRFYQSENPELTITALNGKNIVSVKITYESRNTGMLTLNGVNIESDTTVIMVNANSVTFSVGNTSTVTNGQIRVTAIEVVLEAVECDEHDYGNRFDKKWGICLKCGYVDDNHEHAIKDGKCIYCDYEFEQFGVTSTFDNDCDGMNDIFYFSAALPEEFTGEDVIWLDAFNGSTGTHIEYDQVREGKVNPALPYPHVYNQETNTSHSIDFTFYVEKAGLYDVAVHYRIKDQKVRGAKFVVNGTQVINHTYGWVTNDDVFEVRNNDFLMGSYMTGLTFELQEGENTISILVVDGVEKSQHFRDLYLVFADGSEPECTHSWTPATCTAPKTCIKCGATQGDVVDHTLNDATYKCNTCGKNFLLPVEEAIEIGMSYEKGNYSSEYYYVQLTLNAQVNPNGFARAKIAEGLYVTVAAYYQCDYVEGTIVLGDTVIFKAKLGAVNSALTTGGKELRLFEVASFEIVRDTCTEHVFYEGRCEICGEIYVVSIQSVYDNDGDGLNEYYLFSPVLPEKFASVDAVHVWAGTNESPSGSYLTATFNDITHWYCQVGCDNYLVYTIYVPESGTYEMAIHMRMKDTQERGAMYIVNEGTENEYSFQTSYQFATNEDVYNVRENDYTLSAYMFDIPINLVAGKNTIKIKESAKSPKTQFYRDFYFVKVGDWTPDVTPPECSVHEFANRFEKKWGICLVCGYAHHNHEHVIANGKCVYCDYEFEVREVASTFDNDCDGMNDIFYFSAALPEEFTGKDVIWLDAFNDSTGYHMEYDEIRSGSGQLPYPHVYCSDQNTSNSITFTFNVEKAGLYNVAVHYRIKDCKTRGAKFIINEGTTNEQVINHTYAWATNDDAFEVRNNDFLIGAYMTGLQFELVEGENIITILVADGIVKTQHFRDLYLVLAEEIKSDCEDGHDYGNRFDKKWGICTVCGYVDANHEHAIADGKCVYCDYEFEQFAVFSSFDNDCNDVADIFYFSAALPEEFTGEGVIHLDAFNDSTGSHMEYDEVRAGMTDARPYPHVYCSDQNTSNSITFTFNVEKAGLYNVAVHYRVKDQKVRGAKFVINEGTANEQVINHTYGWAIVDEVWEVRNNDFLLGAYMTGLTFDLVEGENTITIRVADGIVKSQHFRDLYLVLAEEIKSDCEDGHDYGNRFDKKWGICTVCGYVDANHEHSIKGGKCVYCDYEFEQFAVPSAFDNDGDGACDKFYFSHALPEEFTGEDVIWIDAFNDADNSYSHIDYDEYRVPEHYNPPLPYPHAYCSDQSSDMLVYTIKVEKAGLYNVAVHYRIKDQKVRGAKFVVNQGTANEQVINHTYGWSSVDEVWEVRNNDFLIGAYMTGLQFELVEGENTITIRVADGVEKNQHFRDLYLVFAEEIKIDCEDGHSYEVDLINNPARFNNTWGICTVCGYVDDNHEHSIKGGKCVYCDYEFEVIEVASAFDNDCDGMTDIFYFSAALPEEFTGKDVIWLDAFNDSTGTHMEYDEMRTSYGMLPYPHVYCYDQSATDSIVLTFNIEKAGLYNVAVHYRIKDCKTRGAKFIINEGTTNEQVINHTYGWATNNDAFEVRNNDLLIGVYMTGLQFELVEGENTITIRVADGVEKNQHFRDLYLVWADSVCEHEYTEIEKVDPTCVSEGYITYVCSLCGRSATDTIPYIPHSFDEWREIKAPTCTEEGEMAITCYGCGLTEFMYIPALGHSFGEWVMTREPTCTEVGEKTITCYGCGLTEFMYIPALEHSFGDWVEIKAPTCTEPGEMQTRCVVCDYAFIESIPAKGHNIQDGVCTECGVIAFCDGDHDYGNRFDKKWGVCINCGYVDDNHEHAIANGKCVYCDYEYAIFEVPSSFDNDNDGAADIFYFSAALPEEFTGENVIWIDAFNDALANSNHMEYDAVRGGMTNPLPYPHVYCYDMSDDELVYTINVEKAGTYNVAVHYRIKDQKVRGAKFIINEGTANEQVINHTYGWNYADEACETRNNDFLIGAYMTGLQFELVEGKNIITIRIADGVAKSEHFRDLYLIPAEA